MAEEAELHEFCETSSWETNSTPDDDDRTVNQRTSIGSNNFLKSLKMSLSIANAQAENEQSDSE